MLSITRVFLPSARRRSGCPGCNPSTLVRRTTANLSFPPTTTTTTTPTISRRSSTIISAADSTKNKTFLVTTKRSTRLVVGIKEQRVPLPVADLHLRNEQLPFAYFFEKTICDKQLSNSLQRVLRRQFAVAGGRISPCYTAIQCSANDTIPFKVQEADCTLQEWQSQTRQHEQMQGQHPVLLPLFDSLFTKDGDNDDDAVSADDYRNLLSVSVTYFQCGATCLGVTTNHCLADTASCVQLIEAWGVEMSNNKAMAAGGILEVVATDEHGAIRPAICWNRSKASTTGMMTADTAEILGLPTTQASAFQGVVSILPAWMTLAYWKNNDSSLEETVCKIQQNEPVRTRNRQATPTPPSSPSNQLVAKKHEYLALPFAPHVLAAMKSHGMAGCLGSSDAAASETSDGTGFVSTNDMVTAAAWLLKRQLSREASWNLSVVVNLRGRCGINAFGEGGGLFGNAISNVVARLAPSSVYGKTNIRLAAQSIRRALVEGITNEIPDRIATSRLGRATGAPSSLQTFSTTSWRSLAPWKIRFSDLHAVASFAGQPVCPLPRDGSSVYSSVLHSSWDGGCTVELFLPSSQVKEAVDLHEKLCRSYIDWHLNSKTVNNGKK